MWHTNPKKGITLTDKTGITLRNDNKRLMELEKQASDLTGKQGLNSRFFSHQCISDMPVLSIYLAPNQNFFRNAKLISFVICKNRINTSLNKKMH